MENTKPRVIIAEDDKINGSLLEKKLTMEGLDAKVVADGTQLLEEIEKQLPDIVLLDLIMPNMDGFETLSKIRSNEKTKALKVIITSNLSQEEDLAKVKKLGIQKYIVKSDTSLADLVKIVKSFL